MPISDATVSAKRTAVNSAVVLWLIGLVNSIFGWKVELNDVSVLYIGAIIGVLMGIGYRLSRLLTSKWPWLGWVLFGSGVEPAGMKPISDKPEE